MAPSNSGSPSFFASGAEGGAEQAESESCVSNIGKGLSLPRMTILRATKPAMHQRPEKDCELSPHFARGWSIRHIRTPSG